MSTNASHPLMTLVLACAMAVSASPLWAGTATRKINANTATKATATPAQTAVQTLSTAHSLVRYGDTHKDALSLITAARMIKDTGAKPGAAKRDGTALSETKPGDDTLSVEAVLTRARALANGRADLLALADDVAQGSARGAVSGPSRWVEVVSSRRNDIYRITFRGNEPAALGISGDGDSDLDLYVYDENGNLVCKDEGSSDDALCRWQPKWTGEFVIKIRNPGVANRYVIAHN